jgi:hypothetical protein
MTFEEYHRQQASCCEACAENCPHIERERLFWNAATAEAEKQAKKREVEARYDESKWWYERVKAVEDHLEVRLEANRLAARPASGQCVHGRATMIEHGQRWHRDDSSICYGGQAEGKEK